MAKKIFVDTNPFIYLIDKNSPYFQTISDYFNFNRDADFYTSAITDAEFLAKPIAENRLEEILRYNKFLTDFEFTKIPIGENIAKMSAEIRAKYRGIKLADALQLAASIVNECSAFLTNDRQLSQVNEANIVLISDLPA